MGKLTTTINLESNYSDIINGELMKKLILGPMVCVLLAVNIHANLISFYVVETGLPVNGERNRQSLLWENAFLDVFFNSGFIVTNYPMMRLENKPAGSIIEAAGFDLNEAKDAGVDYILIAQLDYSNPLNGPDVITFFVFKITNHMIIYEKKITGRNYRSERDAVEELRNIVREMVPVISSI